MLAVVTKSIFSFVSLLLFKNSALPALYRDQSTKVSIVLLKRQVPKNELEPLEPGSMTDGANLCNLSKIKCMTGDTRIEKTPVHYIKQIL